MFSIVVPLYNRPQEINELLASLCLQSYSDFEVLIIEDGSVRAAKEIVCSYSDRLNVRYYFKENAGQGFARNYGFSLAKGDFFIVFDSDVIVPADYLSKVRKALDAEKLDAFGGPDAAHDSFTTIQKAISYSMTSPLTTGGIRGNKKHVGQFHPRSFNMGISRRVWEQTGGYKLSRRSEDIEFSIRMINSGFKVGLIPEAYVYHKRRTSITQFFKQTYSFGKGRIDISMLYPRELKAVHALPAVFTVGVFAVALLTVINYIFAAEVFLIDLLSRVGLWFLGLYTLGVLLHAWLTTKSSLVAFKAILTSYTQLLAYGLGFIVNFFDRKLLDKNTSN